MAKTPKSVPAGNIDPDVLYRIVIKRAVRLGRNGETVLSPRASENLVKGKVLLTILDDVTSYEPV
jgi:hypothetical protein